MKKTISLIAGLIFLFGGTVYAGEGPSAELTDTLDSNTKAELTDTLDSNTKKEEFFEGIGLGPDKLWRISPGFEYSTVYDSNVNREPRKSANHDVIMNFTPSVALSRIGSFFGVLSDYQMNYQEYFRDSDQSSFNHRFNNKMWYQSDRLTAKVRERFGWVKTYATSEQSERRTVIFNDVNSELIYRLASKVSASALYQNYLFHYKDSALKSNSYVQNDMGGRVYYHATDKADLFVQGSAILTHYYNSGLFDSNGYGIYGGAIGEVTDKTLLSLKTGFEGRKYNNERINPFYNWVGEAALRYSLTSKTDATLIAKRSIQESVYQTTGWYDFDWGGLNLQYHMTSNLTAELGGNFQNNRYPRETIEGTVLRKRLDYLVAAESKLIWEPLHYINLALGYVFSLRNSNFDEFDYIDHAVEASTSLKF